MMSCLRIRPLSVLTTASAEDQESLMRESELETDRKRHTNPEDVCDALEFQQTYSCDLYVLCNRTGVFNV